MQFSIVMDIKRRNLKTNAHTWVRVPLLGQKTKIPGNKQRKNSKV